MANKPLKSRRGLLPAVSLGSVLGVGTALAAPIPLSEKPLFLGTTVEPNIFLLIDDSGSMDWNMILRGFSGTDGILPVHDSPSADTQTECIDDYNPDPPGGNDDDDDAGNDRDCDNDNDAGKLILDRTPNPDIAWLQDVDIAAAYTHNWDTVGNNGFPQMGTGSTGGAPFDEMFINDPANPNWRPPPNNSTGLGASAVCPNPNPNRTGFWRTYNSSFNAQYYNPQVRYEPWKGVDSNNVQFGNASATAARTDAYNASSTTHNLTTIKEHAAQFVYGNTDNDGNGTVSNSEQCDLSPSGKGRVRRQLDLTSASSNTGVGQVRRRYRRLELYPARYYSWDDTKKMNSNGIGCNPTLVTPNGTVDPDDCHELIEIRTSGTASWNATAPASFTRGPGRTDCPSGTCTADQELTNFANWFQYYRRRLSTAAGAFGRVVADTDNARMGMVTLWDNNNNRTAIRKMGLDFTAGDKRTLLNNIYNMNALNGTPLQRVMEHSGQYLECNNTANSFVSSRDTNNDNVLDSYSLSHASGDDRDGNGRDTLADGCPALKVEYGGDCQQNFLIAMTDGYYNTNADNANGWPAAQRPGNTDGPANKVYNPPGNWDGGAMADGVSDTLADIAMKWYETDIQSTLSNNLTRVTGVDENTAQHVVTYTVAFGLDGTITNNTPGIDPSTGMPNGRFTAFNWPNPQPTSTSSIPEKIDDLKHAAFNGRGEFLSAKEPQELIDSLGRVISSISDRTSSASSVALNSGSLNTGTSIFQARFNSGDWTGELLAFPISAGPGLTVGCTTEPVGTVCPRKWNAGAVLAGQSAASRNIISMKTTDKKGPGVVFQWANLDATEQGFLNFNVDTNAADTNGSARVDYLRGDKTNEAPNGLDFRPRTTPLGDIINSDPVFAGAPNQPFDDLPGYTDYRFAQRSRTGMVYVGANDGKLHGFRASDGVERFAFIPGERGIYEDLSGLTSQNYNTRHRYFLDGSPEVSDAEVGGVGAGFWRTILVSGMRTGGQGLFALDVTNPDSFGVNSVMWQFTDVDDRDLGYTHAKPTIAKTQISGKWAAIVGNGYNNGRSTYGSRNLAEPAANVSLTGEACLFIIFLDGPGDNTWTANSEYKKICVTSGGPGNDPANAAHTPNGLSSPAVVDRNGDSIADVVYAGDLEGNLWKFDISSTNLASWGVALGGQPLFRACTENDCNVRQPITARPEVGLHPDGSPTTHGVLVYFGTGRYFANGDNEVVTPPATPATPTQSFYIVWDTVAAQSNPLTRSALTEQVITAEQRLNGSACDPTDKSDCFRRVSQTAVPMTLPGSSPNLGCFLDFQTPPNSTGVNRGERVVSDPVLREGRVVFTTLIPSTARCEFGGTGFLMELSQSCGRLGSPPFDITGPNGVPDGVIDELDVIVANEYPAGIGSNNGILPRPTVLAVTGETLGVPSGCKEFKYMSGTQGGVMKVEESCGYRTGRINWRQIR